MLPEGWKLSKLGDMVVFVNGKAHENDINENGDRVLVNSKFISTEGEVYKKTNKSLCPAVSNDILIVMSDVPNGKAIAKCFYVLENNKYTVNQRIGKLTASGSDPRFIFYAINRNSYYLRFDDGITQTNLKKSEVLDCPIIKPPLLEQKKIAQILSTWDNAISATERLLENSQQRKKALMQQLLTGKKRLPGFEGEWRLKTLNDLYSFKRGKGLSKDLVVPNGKNKCVLYGELYTKYGEVISSVISKTNSHDGLPSVAGDVLLPSSTTTTGIDLANATAVLESEILLGGDIIVLRPKELLDPIFMSHLLTHVKKYEIAVKAQGITIIHLYGSDLKKIVVNIPENHGEQKAIANVLTTADQEIEALQKRIGQLKLEKKALMQQLLTGKRRVQLEDAA